MSSDIQELKRLAEAATKGPWEITEEEGWDEAWCDWHRVGPFSLTGGKANNDSRYIAAASPDTILALIEENERLRRVRIAAQEQLDYMDLCGDKGDLERNLRTALEGVKK